MKAALLGATQGIGRALARQMVARGDTLFLLGRDRDELARSEADLKIRAADGAARVVGFAHCDLEDTSSFAPALAAAERALEGLDAVIVTAGMFAGQAQLEADLELTRRMLTVNFSHTVIFCEHAKARLLSTGGGVVCVFSSVAGERGRSPVVLYGASKAGLSAYLEGLDHREHRNGLRVVCIKPGFVRTGMTAGQPEPPFASDPEPVATRALRAIDRATPVTYAPRIWGLIMLVIRWLPRTVMRRVGF